MQLLPESMTENIFNFIDFKKGSYVADIGCGSGGHLRLLKEAGINAVGVELSEAKYNALRAEGLNAVLADAVKLSFDKESFDGIVCSVVAPYVDEEKLVAEFSRILKIGGEIRASYHGFGYALGMMSAGSIRTRFYGMRMLLNTVFYRITGNRISGWMGDTLCQSPRRMDVYYKKHGLNLISQSVSSYYLKQPVIIYHHLVKKG